MIAKEYQYWVNRLAQYDPRDNKYDDPRSVAYREMIRCNVPLEDRVAIDKAARKLYEERKPRSVGKAPELAMGYCGQRIESIWVDEAAPVDLRPGKVNWFDHTTLDRLRREIVDLQLNTEGEKPMAKIDWKKPLRALSSHGEPRPDEKVYAYKSGKQRVIWIDDRVYPVDEQGHAVADVNYGTHWTRKGVKIVENVPEETFFVGLARDQDGTYWLTDGGTASNMGIINYWKRIMAGDPRPHWVVDTRKPAEPPAVNVHDPKDWTVVIGRGNSTTSYGMRTEAEARYIAKEKERAVGRGDVKVVRVRTTPSPADTARYIQLYRRAGQNDAWEIDGWPMTGRQEHKWDELRHAGGSNEYVHVKVRD